MSPPSVGGFIVPVHERWTLDGHVVAAVRDVNERHRRNAVGTDRRRATRSEEAAQERTRDGTLALGTGSSWD